MSVSDGPCKSYNRQYGGAGLDPKMAFANKIDKRNATRGHSYDGIMWFYLSAFSGYPLTYDTNMQPLDSYLRQRHRRYLARVCVEYDGNL